MICEIFFNDGIAVRQIPAYDYVLPCEILEEKQP
jgi:hypothetical protein